MSKLKLLVAPADTANNSERWYEFVVYLSRTLEQTIVWIRPLIWPISAAACIRRNIVFAPPTEAVLLTNKASYIPVCRPENQSEEVAFATHAENGAASLKGLQGAEVITCGNNVTTRLGLTLLAKKGIKPWFHHQQE